MECSEFLALSSDFRDGRIGRDRLGEMEAHLAVCGRCRRFHSALETGVDVLRRLPDLDVSEDFRDRLTHRIYHIEDGPSIARESLGSGATTLAVLAVALLLGFAAWAPRAEGGRQALELPAVVVSPPTDRTFTAGRRPSTFQRGFSVFTTAEFQDGPWGDTHRLLFEYSSLSERRRSAALSEVGIQ